MARFRVSPEIGGRMRRTPDLSGTIEAVFPQGHPVDEIGPMQGIWHNVRGTLSGTPFSGFMKKSVLEPFPADAPAPLPRTVTPGLKAAHFGENNARVTRRGAAGASPLGEAGMPRRLASDGLSPDQLWAFVDWAEVENPAHLRWKPGQFTFCNIYTHDYCYAAGVYLPRVWWMPRAIDALKAGQPVDAVMSSTVREMNANSLHNWLLDFGADFGWQRAASAEAVQDAANRGAVAVICARRTQGNRPGHITPVIAEGQGRSADRNGPVFLPLQSQAGRVNVRFGTLQRAWWAKLGPNDFDSFVFFFNDGPSRWP